MRTPQQTPFPPQLDDPKPCGTHTVQLLRTYPARVHGYDFAPHGERSIARGYQKVLRRARSLIYLEDQYLWSAQVVRCFAEALAAHPDLRLIAVIPAQPDEDGRMTQAMNLVGRISALNLLRRAGGDRVAVYAPENHAGTPCTSTRKSASSMTCGPPSDRTTSTAAPGRTIPS